jgi:hypothetical protein
MADVAKSLTIKDRIVELRRVKASELRPNPRNWRRHPTEQAEALRGVLTEVGFAGAVLVRETPDGLELIDGHLRTDLAGDAIIPVLVLDVTEAEADKLLATFDPIGAMAVADAEDLATLLKSVETENEAVRVLLKEMEAANTFEMPADADGKEFDESCANDVEMTECPSCGHKFPK